MLGGGLKLKYLQVCKRLFLVEKALPVPMYVGKHELKSEE